VIPFRLDLPRSPDERRRVERQHETLEREQFLVDFHV
jgi:hypothetical protein